jgi:ribonuclease Z
MKFTRREALKTSALAAGALAFGRTSKALAQCIDSGTCYPDSNYATDSQEYSYFNKLQALAPLKPYTPLQDNEMRISFMGSTIPMSRRAQMEMSIFVEVGPWVPSGQPGTSETYDPYGRATDSFMFDIGPGSSTNYTSMGIAFRKMDKLFLTHLHGDHMGDLPQVYCFGPSGDRKSPMYIWGPGPSGVQSPAPPRRLYDDGTKAFCQNFREAMRWHTESFSFEYTAYQGYADHMPTQAAWGTPCPLKPVSDDPPYDGFAIIPIELDWQEVGGIAYNNAQTGVKITHFPVIHCRKGSMGYKLEWIDPSSGVTLSMIFTGDTKPEWLSVKQAGSGGQPLDVFIHEMIVPPDVWAMKMMGATVPPPDTSPYVVNLSEVQNSSHTPQGAFGYLLSQVNPLPRLTVATHFPVSDDTVDCALKSVQEHISTIGNLGEKIVWSFDAMVLRVFAGDPKPPIVQQAVAPISNFAFSPIAISHNDYLPPKYHNADGTGDPYAQIDLSTQIEQKNPDGTENWCDSGY